MTSLDMVGHPLYESPGPRADHLSEIGHPHIATHSRHAGLAHPVESPLWKRGKAQKAVDPVRPNPRVPSEPFHTSSAGGGGADGQIHLDARTASVIGKPIPRKRAARKAEPGLEPTDDTPSEPIQSADRFKDEAHFLDVSGGEIDHWFAATPRPSVDLATIIADISHTYRLRRSLHRQEKGLTLAIKAKERSAAVFRMRANGEVLPEGKFPKALDADVALVAENYPELYAARKLIEIGRLGHEKRLRKLAEMLPANEWRQSVRGFGDLGLAIIIGETGDLLNYANPGKVWKRLGLAPGQRRLKDAEAAKLAGYSPERRSAVWTIGDSLLKGNKGYYRALYLERKAYELARAPDMTPMHAHRRAQRYVEKRLIKHLWQIWRGTDPRLLDPSSAPTA